MYLSNRIAAVERSVARNDEQNYCCWLH